MKRIEILIFTIIFLAASLYSANVVTTSLLHKSLVPSSVLAISQLGKKEAPANGTYGNCTSQEANAAVASSTEPHLRKLAEYQKVCGSFVASEMMIFTDMPNSDIDAKKRADTIAVTLKEFKKAGVKPLVMIEPNTDWGLVDFTEFGQGFYDAWINTYFASLKANGITDADMGTWTPFPEANLPYWNNTNATPTDFAHVVNRYLGIMHSHFPAAKGSVLLNSATYEASDFNWENGEYVSLRDYVKDLDKNLVTSFGLQGFSWMPNALQTGPGIFDASEYLNFRLAQEAADTLGTKQIWFNTGSFGSKYTLDPEKEVALSPSKRQDVLDGIIGETLKLKKLGYDIRINLFSQDKSQVTEATDWSYWNSNTLSSSEAAPVFIQFRQRLQKESISLSLFDITE